jgi:hypothetical protein
VLGRRNALGVATAALALANADAALGAPRPYADQVLATAVPHSEADVATIWRLSQHVLEPHDPRLAPHTLMLTPAAVARLRAQGLEITVQPVDVETLFQAPLRLAAATAHGRLGLFGAWFSKVQDLTAIDQYLDALARASNGRAEVLVVGTSIEGRAIRALRVGTGSNRASILVTGTQHAREWASPMVTMGFADALVRQAAADPQVRAITGTVDVYVVPVVNVDGYVASHRGWRMQRKNMNPRCGVDLNRNFDVAFGLGASPGGCDDENYPGALAFSEPETRAIKTLTESLSNLRLYLDYHSPAEQVMIPFAHTRTRPDHYEKSVAWAQLYAETLQTLYGTLHPAREGYDLAQGQGGGAIDWFRVKFCESFGVELRDGRELAGFQLPADQLIPSVEENWLAFRALAGKVAEENGAVLPADPVVPTSVDGTGRASGCSAGSDLGKNRGAGLLGMALVSLMVAAFSRRARRPD